MRGTTVIGRLGRTLLVMVGGALLLRGAPAADPQPGAEKWVNVSLEVMRQLEAEGAKFDWPGGTAGVTVDPASGDLYMVVPGQGLWKSTDNATTFTRCDRGAVGGRCETAYSLNFDPKGKRLACFMLDGKGAWTSDEGKTWQGFTDIGRNWDFAAVDWSVPEPQTIFAGLHESGGQVMLSTNGGQSWNKVLHDAEFEDSGCLGVFDANTLVYAQEEKGIQRSTDGGRTWTKVSDHTPIGRVVKILHGTAYWLGEKGLLVSKDQGITWSEQGSPVDASIGPMLDPRNPQRMVVAGVAGIYQTTDSGENWQFIAKLPPKADIPKPGWYANVAWDPTRNVLFVSKMGEPTYRLEIKP